MSHKVYCIFHTVAALSLTNLMILFKHVFLPKAQKVKQIMYFGKCQGISKVDSFFTVGILASSCLTKINCLKKVKYYYTVHQ